jgi:peptide-methionine (S)-S-oxide reductase
MAQAILAGGCFWCTEAVFRDVIGVSNVESGYIGGTTENPPTSRCAAAPPAMPRRSGDVRPRRDRLWPVARHLLCHDPTQLNRQGNDVGTQYRSALFPLDETQEAEIPAAIAVPRPSAMRRS